MKLKFPAILNYEEEGVINVSFPDLMGVYTFGTTKEEAILMARNALLGVLITMENIKDIKTTPIEVVQQKFSDVILVEVEI